MPIDGAEIRRIREAMGLSQVAFAKLLGTIGNSVARWERDEVQPRETVVKLIEMIAAQHDVPFRVMPKKAAKKR